ncbi:ALF repeat-containing protein [Streptomyces sp. NBC_00879]|uniref:ALF repeat-containing protein n=1 Tax=Streptomyces sp. NBC_00879 TaxID=2975855 RepID=UPI003863B4FF|nr:ALF repeat-containing protein [Streptomyces sp. NBC_00879]
MDTIYWSRRRSLAVVGKGTRREATGALNDGDSAISAFLAGGFKSAHVEDLRVATATVMATSGKAVTKAGNAALTDGSPAALEKFLTTDQFVRHGSRGQLTCARRGAGPDSGNLPLPQEPREA